MCIRDRSWAVCAKDFPKVILAGDYPDPTILRDGKDYYMTHSPFYYAPGFLIWHSQDLEHWEPVCRAMAQWEGSAMAPDLSLIHICPGIRRTRIE